MEEVYDRPSWGKLAAQTNKKRYGENYYAKIGKLGGTVSRGGGFTGNRELAALAGSLGGTISRRRRKDGSYSPVDRKQVEKRRIVFDKAYKHLLEVNQKANR